MKEKIAPTPPPAAVTLAPQPPVVLNISLPPADNK